MQVGSPLKCRNCGAMLTARATPILECDYCHASLVGPTSTPAIGHAPAPAAGGKGGWVIGGVVLAISAIIAVTVIVPLITEVPEVRRVVAPPAPVEAPPPAKPAAPPSIATAVLSFREAGTGAGQLTVGRALAVTGAGDIVVIEASTGRAQVFDATGAYQRVITLPPSQLTKSLSVFGAGGGNDHTVVVARDGDLLVLDASAGTVTRTIRGTYPDIHYHGDVEVAPDGSIYAVTDRTGDLAIRHLSADGTLLGTIPKAKADHLAVDGVGTVFLSREWDKDIDVRDAKGEVKTRFAQGNPARGALSRPGPVAFDGKGRLFVEDSGRILILDPAGAFLGEFEPGSPNDIAVDRAGFLYTLTASKVTKYKIAL